MRQKHNNHNHTAMMRKNEMSKMQVSVDPKNRESKRVPQMQKTARPIAFTLIIIVTLLAFFPYSVNIANAVTVIDSYSESNIEAYPTTYVSGPFPNGGSAIAQTFNSPGDYAILSASFLLQKQGSPSFNLQALLFTTTSSDLSVSLPANNIPVARSEIVHSNQIVSGAMNSFSFSGQYVIGQGVYAIAIASVDGARDNNNDVAPGLDTTAPTHPGSDILLTGTPVLWTRDGSPDFPYDMIFSISGEYTPPSPSPAGFGDSPSTGESGGGGFFRDVDKQSQQCVQREQPGKSGTLGRQHDNSRPGRACGHLPVRFEG